jgi:hypothetical protein
MREVGILNEDFLKQHVAKREHCDKRGKMSEVKEEGDTTKIHRPREGWARSKDGDRVYHYISP